MALGGKASHEIISSRGLTNEALNDPDFIALTASLNSLKKKYDFSSKKLIALAENPDLTFPISIFSKDISSFEAIVKYLHEEKKLGFVKIANLTSRDQRTIWCTYNNAKKKSKERLVVRQDVLLPLSVINTREYSILESITSFLKEEYGLSFSAIAKYLQLDQRTIWTCYDRFKKKRIRHND